MPIPEPLLSAHIPKPRMALNIGISGHRPNKMNAVAQEEVAQSFRRLADQINDQTRRLLAKDHGQFYREDAPLIRIVTGLAEGADRLVLQNLPPRWEYEAILPLPRNEYALDFKAKNKKGGLGEFRKLLDNAITVTELPMQNGLNPRSPQDRPIYYSTHGDFLVRQIDILIAVWDGEKAAGPGGTAEVIDKALELGLPVIWINLKRDEAASLITQGSGDASSRKYTTLQDADLSAILSRITAPPSTPSDQGHGQHGHSSNNANAATPGFLNKTWPGPSYFAFAYTLLRWLCGAGRLSWPVRYGSLRDQMASWDPLFKSVAGADQKLSENLSADLCASSVWADALAWYYGQVYRSAYVSVFILASLSVPIGLCYLFFLSSPLVLDIKAGFVVLELLIITTVVVVVKRGGDGDWHGQWLQTRKLSELLRLGRNLAYVGASRSFVSAPSLREPEDFPNWYVRATFRDCHLPNAELNAAYLRIVLSGINETEFATQRAYHRSNAANLGRIHHMLHRLGDLSFMATIALLLIYLVSWGFDHLISGAAAPLEHTAEAGAEAEGNWFHELLEYVIKPIVSIAAAGLPAFGAGITGIREQGDFEGFAERSHTTQHQLYGVEAKMKTLLGDPATLDLYKSQSILLFATEIMAKDVTAWHQQFSSKRLALPA